MLEDRAITNITAAHRKKERQADFKLGLNEEQISLMEVEGKSASSSKKAVKGWCKESVTAINKAMTSHV